MSGQHRILASVVLLALAVLAPAVAWGQGPWLGGYPGFWMYPYGGYGYQSNFQTPPYFAIHPPVYLGQRLALPYGTSPLPALPWQASAGDESTVAPAAYAEPAKPGVMIENPYVVGEQQLPPAPRPKRPLRQRRAAS